MGAGEGIDYEIRIDSKLSALDKTINRVDSLIEKLERTGKAAEHNTRKTEAGFKGIGKSIDETKKKAHEFFEFVGAVAAVEVLDKLADKFAEVGKEAIKSAAHAERMNRVIDAVSGGHEAGEGNRKWLSEFSKKTEFSEDTSEGAFVDLKRVGSSDQAAKLAIKAAGDIAAVSRDKDFAFGEAISAFSRLERTGKVSNRTLAPLGLGEKDFAALPEFAKLSQKQLEKKIEEGSVDRNQLMRLIMAHTGESAIGSRAADNADLLETKFEKLTQLPELFYKRLGDTRAVGELSRALDGALEKLDPDSPAGQKIFGGLEHGFEAVADAVGKIDFDAVADGVADLAADIGPAIALMKELGADAKIAAHYLSEGFELWQKYTPVGIATSFVGRKIAERMAAREGLDHVVITDRMKGADPEEMRRKLHEMGGPKPAMEGPIYEAPELTSLNAYAYGTGKSVGDGLAKGITDATHHAVKAAGDMAHHTTRATRKALDSHSPSVVFEDLGATVPDGFSLGIKRGGGRVGDALDDMLSIPSPRAGSVAARGGGITVTVGDINVSVDGGGSPTEIAGAVREELMRSLRPELLSLFEQVNLEGGS